MKLFDYYFWLTIMIENISKKLNRIDYSDLYTVHFSSKNQISKEDFLKSFFLSFPKWAQKAMNMDNELNSGELLLNKNIVPGEKFFFFNVIDVTEYEIILGGNENSMSYHLAVAFVNNIDDKYIGVVSTRLYIKKFSGKIYFFFVKPFHKLLMKRACERIEKKYLDQTVINCD
jgi:hypothetical protein